MQLNYVRRGSGKRLLLIPGLGATWQSWETIFDALTSEREVIAVDLPGFGATPPLPGEVSIATLCDAVADFIDDQDLTGIDLVAARWAPGWCSNSPGVGRHDRVTFPHQAKTATRLFPDARLYWFDHCGHFPPWDVPEATPRLILDSTA